MAELLTESMKRFNYLEGEIEAAYHEAALKFGLSDSAMHIFYAVCTSGGDCLVSDISRLCGIKKQTVNSALRRLEAEGAVYLEPVDSKRKKVCLTERGRVLAERSAGRLIRIENEILDSWSAQEREQYLAFLHRYLNDFRRKIEEV